MKRYRVFWTEGPGDLTKHHNITVTTAADSKTAAEQVIKKEEGLNNSLSVTVHRVDPMNTGETPNE